MNPIIQILFAGALAAVAGMFTAMIVLGALRPGKDVMWVAGVPFAVAVIAFFILLRWLRRQGS